jgi:hypothetical protein
MMTINIIDVKFLDYVRHQCIIVTHAVIIHGEGNNESHQGTGASQ